MNKEEIKEKLMDLNTSLKEKRRLMEQLTKEEQIEILKENYEKYLMEEKLLQREIDNSDLSIEEKQQIREEAEREAKKKFNEEWRKMYEED